MVKTSLNLGSRVYGIIPVLLPPEPFVPTGGNSDDRIQETDPLILGLYNGGTISVMEGLQSH